MTNNAVNEDTEATSVYPEQAKKTIAKEGYITYKYAILMKLHFSGGAYTHILVYTRIFISQEEKSALRNFTSKSRLTLLVQRNNAE